MELYLITILLFLPLLAAVSMWGHSAMWLSRVPLERIREHYRWIALGFAGLEFLLSLVLLFRFDSSKSEPQFVINIPWIEGLGARYHVGIDGISLWLVILTTFLVPIAILVTWRVNNNVRAYFTTLFLAQVGIIGVFVSLDMLLFYLFWEMSIIPVAFLIGVWGAERERRVPATIKFLIFTVVGSLFMLVAIIGVYYYSGATTFDLIEVTRVLNEARAAGKILIPESWAVWFWLAFALGFLVKIPLWPLHAWLPETYVQAPTSGSILLAGVMAKMGAYGLIRFNLPLFPELSMKFAPYVMALAVIGLIYGALVAIVQSDLKRLVAYSSLSHLGYVVLGIFAFTSQSMQGALFQMVNHGISTGALFVCVGLITQRRQTREISEFGGMATQMPGYSTAFMIIAFSSLGLPLLNGFIGEILILIGTFSSSVPYAKVFAIIGAAGVVLASIYILWKMQRVLFGAVTKEENKELEDLTRRERVALIPMVALAIVLGVTPMVFLSATDRSVNQVRSTVVQQK
ncbi:MAG TPA: NADH-quinone oxidoreductase subunit M [Blastocatellia bacterium]|nr:NADH-quinone oxidoreductase subunit M [Blastocatellia bacterium]